MAKNSIKEIEIISVIKHGRGLQTDEKGRMFYTVPSTTRRNNRMLVSKKEIDKLKKANLI